MGSDGEEGELQKFKGKLATPTSRNARSKVTSKKPASTSKHHFKSTRDNFTTKSSGFDANIYYPGIIETTVSKTGKKKLPRSIERSTVKQPASRGARGPIRADNEIN